MRIFSPVFVSKGFLRSCLVGALLSLAVGCKWESPSPNPTPTPSPSPSPTVTPSPTPIIDLNVGLQRNPDQQRKARQAAPLLEQIALTQANFQYAVAGLGAERAGQILEMVQGAVRTDSVALGNELAAGVEDLLFLHGRVEPTNFYRDLENEAEDPGTPQTILPAVELLASATNAFRSAARSANSRLVWPDPLEAARQDIEQAAAEVQRFWLEQQTRWNPGVKDNFRQLVFLPSEKDPVGQILEAQMLVGSYELLDTDSPMLSAHSPVVRGRLAALQDALLGGDGSETSLGVFGPGLIELLSFAAPEIADRLPILLEQLQSAQEPQNYLVLREQMQELLRQAALALGYSWNAPTETP